MNDGPRRAGPPAEDEFYDSVFRDGEHHQRAPKYVDTSDVDPSDAGTPEVGTSDKGTSGVGPSDADGQLFDRHHPFTRSLIKTAGSTVVPGLGLIRSRVSTVGWLITGLWVVFLAAVAIYVISDPVQASSTAVKPGFLRVLTVALLVLGGLWVAVITGTHLITRPAHRTRTQRLVGALAVSLLSFLVAAPLAVAARYSSQQAGLVNDVFSKQDDKKSQTRPTIDTKGKKVEDVWAAKPRLNILLVGLDNTAKRNYSDVDVSTDTMMVASIDTATGNTVIIQIPRNMAKMQFPSGSDLAKAYPQGFYDGVNGDNDNYFANAVWGHAPAEQPDLFTHTDYKGADALKLGMEGTLGLKIDYFVALNIEGLVKLIDAMGGVTVNVNQRIPIGGSDTRQPSGYIEPGPDKKLNGYYAMWYARGRHGVEGGDFNRMGRQTCVIKAVIDQADPATMLTRYEAIANASKQMISTDIPQEMLPSIVELARRVKNGKQTRVLFVHEKDGFITYDPDFEMMRERVKKAIETVGQATGGKPATTAPGTPGSESSSSPTSGGSSSSTEPSSTEPSSDGSASEPGASPSSKATAQAESLTDACAYNPVTPQR